MKQAIGQAKESGSAEDALENLKIRQAKLTQEHQRMRIENEDDEALYRHMLEEVIHIDDPGFYRQKIKGFALAFGVRDMKERLAGIINEAEIKPKAGGKPEDGGNYSFKPYLYKDPYKGRVQSVIR